MSEPVRRPLVLAAHGTADPAGRAVVEQVAARVAEQLGVAHWVGYVDVCGPTLQEVLTEADVQLPPVVVPFFLASGYHVRHDVPSAVTGVTGATVTAALGVEDEVVRALSDRVLAVGTTAGGVGPPAHTSGPAPGAVVVTGAGSSMAAARAEVAETARRVGQRLGVATGTAFLSGPGPRPEQETERLRAAGHSRVVLAAHLLAPGRFLDRARLTAASCGAVATDALGWHEEIQALVVRRYREAPAPAAD